MLSLIRVSRPINLLIVALTQYFFYFLFFINGQDTSALTLYPNLLLPFISVTVIITMCGYYINDFFDFESDLKNHKKNRLKNKSRYLSLYFLFLIVGFIIAYWIACTIDSPRLSLIYIVANFFLFIYSSHWKKKILIGNFIVALFSTFVLLIMLYAEWNIVNSETWQSNTTSGLVIELITFYSAFIFLISMIREMIKDIEDVDGDNSASYKTLPIIAGIQKAQVLCGTHSLLLLFIMLGWYYSLLSIHDLMQSVFFWVMIFLPTLLLTVLIFKASNKNDFRKLSLVSKAIMLSGLIYLIILCY